MEINNTTKPFSQQWMDNASFDKGLQHNTVMPLGFDGTNRTYFNSDNLAVKITVSGSVTYVGTAPVGTAQSTAKWQCKKIDETTGTVITWADGDAEYNNIATDLTALNYS